MREGTSTYRLGYAANCLSLDMGAGHTCRMRGRPMAWNELVEGSGAWVFEYDVPAYGPTNALAVRLEPGTLAVLSPPIGCSEADFTALEALGRVTALVAPHSGHDLGLASWQTRYPEALSYAPADALPLLARKALPRPFRALSTLATPPEVEFRELSGARIGGTCVRVRRGARPVVFLDELIHNQAALPRALFPKFLFWVSGSAPGLHINRPFKAMLCRDPALIARTLLEYLDGEPVLIPAHGAPLDRTEDRARVRTLLQSLV